MSKQTTVVPERQQRVAQPAQSRPPRPTFWSRVRLWLGLGLGFVLLVIGVIYWQIFSLSRAMTVADARPNPPLASPLMGANLLIIGTDERPGFPQEGVRGDTLMLARLDPAGRWVSLLSIPRDSQIAIPAVGLDVTKINAAYGQGYAGATSLYGDATTPQQGGMALAAETVEALLQLRERNMRVDFVATVNFAGFAQIIDALGGVTIDVPARLVDEAYPTDDFGVMRVEFAPGPQKMDGTTALIYARTRHQDSDFGRAQRQQQVVQAILQEVRERGVLGQVVTLPALVRAVDGSGDGISPVVTTLPVARLDVLFALASLAATVEPGAIGQFGLGPAHLAATNGTNLIWDQAAVQGLLDAWQQRPVEVVEEVDVQVFNGTDVSGLARLVSLDLEQAGFRMLPAANAPLVGEQTRVYHTGGAPTTSRRVAQTLKARLVNGPLPEGVASSAPVVVVLGTDAVR